MTQQDKRWNHGWGFEDTQFALGPDGHVTLAGKRYDISGFPMPHFLPFVDEVLGVQVDRSALLERTSWMVPAPKRNEAFCAALVEAFSDDQYTVEDGVRATHSHGQSTADEVYQALYGRLKRVVDLVFFCDSEESAVTLTALAKEHNVCLIPYGGGTNVTGALMLPEGDTRMIVSVDTTRMNKIEWVQRASGQACVQAGITGTELERRLNAQGLTCGHEPDSMELSTLGGWISTNASGMKRNRYGAIEDIVEQVTVATPTGKLETLQRFPRQSAGIQVRPALFGSEGNLGLITKAVLRVRELPEKTTFQSLIFPNFHRGVDFLRALVGTSYVPASIRLVDNAQFRFGHALKAEEKSTLSQAKSKAQKLFLQKVKGIDLMRMCAATLVMEGGKAEVEAQERLIGKLADGYGGFFAGGSNGKRGYNLTFAIAYIRDFLTQMHIMGETIETTAPWDKLHDICTAMQKEAAKLHKDLSIPGKPFLSFRVTQLYTTGVCLYTTYGVYTKGLDGGHIAREADRRLRQAIVDAGGAISNHHGIGKFRSDVLAKVLPESNVRILQAIKDTVDPTNTYGAANGIHSAPFAKSRRPEE